VKGEKMKDRRWEGVSNSEVGMRRSEKRKKLRRWEKIEGEKMGRWEVEKVGSV
jgi:hypothetical protein